MAPKFPGLNDVFQDRYKIQAVLNRGGYGRVYRASQVDLNRDVAIKVLQPLSRYNGTLEEDESRLEIVTKRFEREAQLVSQLRDSHTVMMHDYGMTDDGLLYMVLEYVDGRPLNEVIDAEGALAPERVVKIARQILSSLEEAHALGMLHRDIKPQNIMLFDHIHRKDQVKVLDFGLAKSMNNDPLEQKDNDLTAEEVIIGTPRYMSPEQIRGDDLLPASDFYSLGLVLYEMLTGEKAVQGESTMNNLARHLNEDPIELPAELALPGGLRGIVDRMLLKDPARRYQSAAEILEILERWEQKPSGFTVPTPDVWDPAALEDEEYLRRRRFIGIGAASLFLLLVVGGVAFSLAGTDEPHDGQKEVLAAEAKAGARSDNAPEGDRQGLATTDEVKEPVAEDPPQELEESDDEVPATAEEMIIAEEEVEPAADEAPSDSEPAEEPEQPREPVEKRRDPPRADKPARSEKKEPKPQKPRLQIRALE